jgi:hypothetical protein
MNSLELRMTYLHERNSLEFYKDKVNLYGKAYYYDYDGDCGKAYFFKQKGDNTTCNYFEKDITDAGCLQFLSNNSCVMPKNYTRPEPSVSSTVEDLTFFHGLPVEYTDCYKWDSGDVIYKEWVGNENITIFVRNTIQSSLEEYQYI